MRLGFSSYSFSNKILTGTMSMTDVIEWVAASDGEHLEVATKTFSPPGADESWNLDDDPALLDTIESVAKGSGVTLSGVCMPADFLVETADERRAQVDRVKHHIEICDRLGVRFLRHDVTKWKRAAADVGDFERNFPILVDASGEIARFAARYGIQTSIENHGFFVNASERVRRLIYEVGEPNFGTTLDVGNFLCVDEDPVVATTLNIGYTRYIHMKDFYVRPRTRLPGDGWLRTAGGNYLLGSIVGFGDMDIPGIVRVILSSGYEGFASIEFEGNEDCLFACRTGFANLRRIIAENAGAST